MQLAGILGCDLGVTSRAFPTVFLQEHLLMSEHRRETRRSQKKDVVKAVMDANAEAAKDPAVGDGEEGAEQLLRPHTISYYAVDFPRMFDALQLRLHIMRKVLKVRRGVWGA